MTTITGSQYGKHMTSIGHIRDGIWNFALYKSISSQEKQRKTWTDELKQVVKTR